MNKTISITLMYFGSLLLTSTFAGKTQNAHRFTLSTPDIPANYQALDPLQSFSAASGYGWMNNSENHFGVAVPEGNYSVKLIYDSPDAANAMTVKAESRRVMLTTTGYNSSKIRSFTVNVRQPHIASGGKVTLNNWETTPTLIAHWDELLTLEFLPDTSGLTAIEIEPASKVTTLYIAGDSTVADQRSEPYAGWGQMLPSLFNQNISIANHAESGRALFSFLDEHRFDKILSTIQPGDYLFIQFGHNDQKDKRNEAGPYTTYTSELIEYVNATRDKSAIPVLITPMERRRWKNGEPGETLSEYADAVRRVGKALNVSVIDLHAMSLAFYNAMGEVASTKAFVHYPSNTYPDQPKQLKDNTHHNAYGALQLAKCIAEGIRVQIPGLAQHLRPEYGNYSPSHPDDPATTTIPASFVLSTATPEGN
ncbi:rhamnogalacturonan acetylesterase [Aestuariibacter sp. GS-14]|uniref:rhamnogalacturonan acetylesterase n=1 Tax=Aestuariibacter sp. GS-14 TaxID=2590670 RepID=UPI00112B5152|nr:rhamnogalacturonan acetylesterase [Aestuariibacter sp. GS-14]TPV58540.1 rhamnogalacturonan acetylesterase [Aestuariibacter sp. GS-14]